MSELEELDCCSCGITFSFAKNIAEMWRKSQNPFYCPNGHFLAYPPPKEDKAKKETDDLRLEVKDLKDKLALALENVEKHSKKIAELTLEIEIWHPTDKSVAV